MRIHWLLFATSLGIACTGTVSSDVGNANEDSPNSGGATGGGLKGGSGGKGQTSGALDVSSMPLRRLSRQEYANTLRDLLGETPSAEELFSVDESGPFGYAQGGPVSSQEVERMLDATSAMVDKFAKGPLKTKAPCQPKDEADRSCVDRIVKWFSARAFRRPISDIEAGDLMKAFDAARTKLSLGDALAETLQLVLLSPRFSYHWERGDEAPVINKGLVVLTDYEVASRLSYFLWQTMPDDELLEVARTGGLVSGKAVGAQVKRMLAEPKASQGIRAFVTQWLPLRTLRADDLGAPDHDRRAAMQESLLMFVDDLVLGKGDRRFATLMAGNYAFANGELAELMGVADVPATAAMRRVTLQDKSRAGLFTQPGFLAATSDTPLATVIHRGRFVYERLGSCAAVPPPSGAIPPPPPVPPNASVREHLQAHANDGVCKGCHQFMDPMGFAFDKFDSLGRLRTKDDYGKPATTAGVMPLNDTVELKFVDAADMLRQLSTQDAALRCFARQLFSYGLRLPNDERNETAIGLASDAFAANAGDIAALMATLAQSSSFFVRQPSKGEVLQ